MSYQAGDTYPATVTIKDEDGVLTDPESLTLKVRDNTGVVTTYDYPDDPIDRDGVGEYHADVLLSDAGMWVLQWSTTDEEQVEGVQIAVSPAPTIGVTFATLSELALRLGKTSTADLTVAQRAQGQMLLELVTGVIVEVVGRDDDWAATLNPIPHVVRGVCLEAVARVMHTAINNPTGMSSESETLGAYSHTTRYGEGGGTNGNTSGGLALTDAEAQMCRRAVLGSLSGSATLESFASTLRPYTLSGLIEAGPDDPPIYDWTE